MNNQIEVICNYCGKPAMKVTGLEIWPHRSDLQHKTVWQCKPCNAYVGCHPGTEEPMGHLANAELRYWRRKAHSAFDPIWRHRYKRKKKLDPSYKKSMARGGRYKRLAELMNLDREQCHIGMFEIEQCKQVVILCQTGQIEN